MTTSDPRLSRVTAIINAKGGVFKTSATANLAGEFAHADLRILAIDLDLSGNLAFDLGYLDRADRGEGLVVSLMKNEPFPVIKQVRPNLDVVAGGSKLSMLTSLENDDDIIMRGGLTAVFTEQLAELADSGGYDLILVDTAPSRGIYQQLALAAARYVIIPTKTDPASWDGLKDVGPQVRRARQSGNPDLTYLGILVTGNQSSAKSILRNTRTFVEEAFPSVPLFESKLRHSELAAQDCRIHGWLAREHPRAARRDDGTDPKANALFHLAQDYRALAREVMHRILAAEGAPTTTKVE